MKGYIKNNIKFRIVSSNSIAQFKSAQAFDFNEISNGSSAFLETTREVLLLEYEYIFKWITRAEKLFLLLNDSDDASSLFQTLIIYIDHLMSDIEEVMGYYPNEFSNYIIEYIANFHNSYYDILEKQFKKYMSSDIYSAYPRIVNCVSEYLQQLVFVLHDYDNNVMSKRDEPFLSFTDISIESLKENGYQNLINRAHFFKRNFDINTFILKNYSNHDNFEMILNTLVDNDIKITSIKNIKTKIGGASE